MIESNEECLGLNISYKYKKRKYDCKHVVFVFSGFGGGDEGTYDFDKALLDCPSHVIWIKDFFYGKPSYYIYHGMKRNIEDSISCFIFKFLDKLNLTKDDCTMAGFSKGGTAALYYAIKLDIRNVVITVPQFYIGDYISKNWPRIATHMMGEVNEENINILNSILPDVIERDAFLSRNIYLITSKADIQYKSEIEPNLHRLIKYDNFNILLGKSLLINEHKQVTPYHVPLILGIIYSLSQGAVPYFGYCEMRGDETLSIDKTNIKPVAILNKASVDKMLFFPEGISFIRGVPCPHYRDISVKMIIENENISFSFALGKEHLSNLTRKVYDGTYVNYDKGGFTSPKYNGIDLVSLCPGVFSIFLEIICGGVRRKTELKVPQSLNDRVLCENESYSVYSLNGMAFINKFDF